MPKEERFPERGEVVIGTVSKVNPYSAFVSLEEYPGKEGMIHISEVAGKWVRDIRKFVKVGDKVVVKVMRLDRAKGHITLSLKRVRKYESDQKMKEYKKKIKAGKMVDVLPERLKMKKEDVDAYVKEIEDIFGNIFDVFQMSMTPQGYELLIRKGVKEEFAKVIKEIADEQLEIKESTIKRELELKCFASDGINKIKDVLIEAKKEYNIDIKYISAPRYNITLKTKNAKMGERKVDRAAENIIKRLENVGGEGKVI